MAYVKKVNNGYSYGGQVVTEADLMKRFSEGGEIKGKGTAKSDSIKAKVRPGSFVVPAENADKAEEIRNEVLPKKTYGGKIPKAKLNQKGGEDVKLSNGEHLFTPEEKAEIEKYGYDVDALAPNAEDKEGMKKGGLTPSKARQMLHDKTAQGHPLTDKQRRYFGYIASKGKSEGGVTGYKDGGDIKERLQKASSDYQDALYSRKTNPLYTDADLKKYKDALDAVTEEYKASLKSTKVPVTKKQTTSKTEASTQAPESDLTAAEQAAFARMSKGYGKPTNAAQMTNKPEAIRKSNLFGGKVNLPTFNPNTYVANDPEYAPLAEKTQTPRTEGYGNVLAQSTKPVTSTGQKPSILGKSKLADALNLGRGLVSNLSNYIIPYKQTQMGLQYLAKAGARPVGQIDPEFQASVNMANAAAKYGFTPEEESYISQQNVDALNAQKAAARNYSGGSAANAYNMERDAVNQYFGRGLQAKIASRNLQLEKQQQASEMNLAKANMSRQLFQDSLNAWNQNQQSGSALLNAGLSNAIGAKMYGDELAMQRERSNIGNNWLDI